MLALHTDVYELKSHEIGFVSGGISSDTGYATSIGASVAIVGLAIATGGAVALTSVMASYSATGMAFNYADE